MPDFTLKRYSKLMDALHEQGFEFLPFKDFQNIKEDQKQIILRHDVDALPGNSLQFAVIEAEKGIKGTYYFRIVPKSFDEKIIKDIYSMGHEVGYHYEDISLAAQRLKGSKEQVEEEKGRRGEREKGGEEYERYLAGIAIESFAENLERLRNIVPVSTICMHGSPLSKWDNRLLWKYYDYHEFGIVGEPYFDINFEEVLYLTDTGRRWDGGAVSIRDKSTGVSTLYALRSSLFPKFHTTFNIIKAAEAGNLPDKIMMTFHPQRWTDKLLPWLQELLLQNTKNVAKYFLFRMRQ